MLELNYECVWLYVVHYLKIVLFNNVNCSDYITMPLVSCKNFVITLFTILHNNRAIGSSLLKNVVAHQFIT